MAPVLPTSEPPAATVPTTGHVAPAANAVVCFGEALIDFLARPAIADAPRVFVEQAGGAPANVAVGVARLGGAARFIGMLSRDMFGDVLLAQLRRHGVDTAQVLRTDAARTALAFVSLDADGERHFNFYRPPAADLLFTADDFAADAFDNASILHVCSNSLTAPGIADATLHGMDLAAGAGLLVSMDVNLRSSLWPVDVDPVPTIWQALSRAHLVKLSRGELDVLSADGGEAAMFARLFAAAAQAVIVTDGAAAMRWYTRTSTGSMAAFEVDALDTTAAGDAFVAGLLHWLAAHAIEPGALAATLDEDTARNTLLRHAAACGALATQRHGAFDAMPSSDDVRHLLESQP